MCKIWYVVLFVCINRVNSFDISDFTDGNPITTRQIVEETVKYYQNPDPYGIPVFSIPEPFEIEDPVLLQAITVSNVSISGHSKIRLKHFLVELERLEAKMKVNIAKLEVIGDYLWPGYWSDSLGVLNLTLVNLDLGLTVNLYVDSDGVLQIFELTPSLEKDEFLLDMTGLSAGHQLLVYAGNTFFDTIILPFVNNMIESEVIAKVNPMMKTMLADQKLPIDIRPVDYFIAKFKKSIEKDENIDPLFIPDTKVNVPLPVSIEVTNIKLEGLSSLHRRGTLSTELVDDKIHFRFLMGTKKLKVSCSYSVYSSVIYLNSGDLEFIIDDVEVYIHVHQPVNIRYAPTLRKIDIELGNFILMVPGDSNIQYLLELSVNLLPNIFRNSILDKKVESTLKEKIQTEFGAVELDKYVEEALDKYFPEDFPL